MGARRELSICDRVESEWAGKIKQAGLRAAGLGGRAAEHREKLPLAPMSVVGLGSGNSTGLTLLVTLVQKGATPISRKVPLPGGVWTPIGMGVPIARSLGIELAGLRVHSQTNLPLKPPPKPLQKL